jgi:hypothetical protein
LRKTPKALSDGILDDAEYLEQADCTGRTPPGFRCGVPENFSKGLFFFYFQALI